MHYQYTDEENHRTFYYKKLSELWNINYEKEGKKYKFCSENYQRLKEDSKASQIKAIERAQKLYKKQENLAYHKQNPITLIYQLVKLLNDNLKK